MEEHRNGNPSGTGQDVNRGTPEQPFSPVEGGQEELRHSGIGIASAVIAAIAYILMSIGISMFMDDAPRFLEEIINNASLTEEEAIGIVSRYPDLVKGTLLFMASGFLLFIGCIIGIVSLFVKERRKLFPILGTVLNVLPALGWILLMAAGSWAV